MLHVVELFPGEEFYLHGLVGHARGRESLGYGLRFAAHVAVGSRFLVDGTAQLEALLDGMRREREDLLHFLGNLSVGKGNVRTAVGVHVNAHRLCHADGIAQLHEHLVGHARSHHILGDVAGGIGSRAVYLRGVFARESAAAVCAATAVGVHDDFAPRKSRVAVRASDDELARGVYIIFNIGIVEEAQHLGRIDALAQQSGNEYLLYVAGDALAHGGICGGGVCGVGDKLVVLRAHHNGINALRAAFVVVLNSHLALGVGTEVSHFLALAAYLGKHREEFVGKGERQGHISVGLVAGVAEHHALVAGTLLLRLGAVDAAVDVCALLMDSREDAAAFGLKLIGGLGVTDAGNGAAHHVLNVYVSLRLYLACHNHLPRRDEGFAGNFRIRVESQELVEHGVGNLVSHFVGMPFRHGF